MNNYRKTYSNDVASMWIGKNCHPLTLLKIVEETEDAED
jgi:hypothetical protein